MQNVRILAGTFVLAIFVLQGCATFSEKFAPIEKKIAARQYDDALALIEKNKGPDRDAVLYLMNKGMVQRMNGAFAESNKTFEEAKSLIDKYSTISITEQAGAVSVNDSMRAFAGAPFERVLLHVYKALNYLELNDTDAARVEAMQIDSKLQELSKEKFKDEGFSRYMMGMIFETLREYDDAMIAYRHAYEVYKGGTGSPGAAIPETLKADLLRVSKKQGFNDEFDTFKKEFESTTWVDAKTMNGKGEFIALLHNSLAPIKDEKSLNTVFDGRLVRIAVPYYRNRNTSVDGMKVKAGDQVATAALADNIDATANRSLDDEMTGIIARAAARVVVKHKTANKVGEANGLLGLIMNIFGFVSERADTRSWVTLPNRIHVARLPLDPGQYDIEITLLDHSGGQVGTHTFKDVKIDKGKKVFRSYHWLAGY